MSVAALENPVQQKKSIPLQRLNSGQMATVAGLHGSNHEIARLAEMGLRQGTVVLCDARRNHVDRSTSQW